MKWLSIGSQKARLSLLVSAFLAIVLIATLIPACGNGDTTTTPTTSNGTEPPVTSSGGVTLTLVSGWSNPWTGNHMLEEYIERINKEGKGKVFINYLGGAEVAPITESGGLVRDGIFDMVLNAPGYYAGLCPQSVMAHYAPPDPVLLREIGATAMMDSYYRKKMNVTTLGILWRGENFTILSREKIETANFRGLLMHSLPIFTAGLTYLGASTQALTTAEFYVAMERGVVDAIPLPSGAVPYDLRLQEVSNYIIYPRLPLYGYGPLMVNLDRWNSLSQDVQDLLLDTVIDMEPEVYAYYVDVMNTYEKKLTDEGMEIVELKGEEAEKLNYAFTTFAWTDFIRVNGEDGIKYFELLKPYFDWAEENPPDY